ncbi:MAG: hypothetical protein JXB10_11770 [Pirellulales bacterium]|nr:hypothetical protein [Pirellulales bacterium]
MRYAIAALGLLLLAGCEGCRETTELPAPSNASFPRTEGGKRQQELLQYAIKNLERLEEFHSGEMMERILQRTREVMQPDGVEKQDRLTAAWPQPPMLRQIVDRLNSWLHAQTPPAGVTVDPAVSALPAPLRKLPLVEQLDKMHFVPFDGFALQEAVLMRDASAMACGGKLDELIRAENLFDWVVRNVQLEPEEEDSVPQFPWETLFFGRGTVWQRAWVFILMARQQGIDAAVLAVRQPAATDSPLPLGEGPGVRADSAENSPHPNPLPKGEGTIGTSRPRLRPWCVGVRIGEKVYLFDPLWGLPIPEPDGVKFDAQGQLALAPATLEQAQDDPAILKRMNDDPAHPYPFQAADVKDVTACVEASPAYLELRMKLLEPYFTGGQKLVLSVSPSAEFAEWKQASGVTDAQLWLLPYETIQARSTLSAPLLQGRLLSFLPFYALPYAVIPKEGGVPGLETGGQEPSLSGERFVEVPLYKGRILHLKGQLTGDPGAMMDYLLARPSQQEMAVMREAIVNGMVEQGMKGRKDLDEAEAQRLEAKLRQLAEAEAQIRMGFIDQGKQCATYWLGLVAYQRGNFPAAIDYLYTRTLEIWPTGIWAYGARYNYARSMEAQGDIESAVLLYQSNPPGTLDAAGQLLRAKWLQARPKPEKTK